jgi:hypothetical protein
MVAQSYAADLSRSVQIMERLSESMQQWIEQQSVASQPTQRATELLVLQQRTASYLLDSAYADTWAELQPNEQKAIANNLMLALHHNAFLLASVLDKPNDYVHNFDNICKSFAPSNRLPNTRSP